MEVRATAVLGNAVAAVCGFFPVNELSSPGGFLAMTVHYPVLPEITPRSVGFGVGRW